MKKKNIRDAGSFNDLLDIKYGKVGTAGRDKFEAKAKDFVRRKLAQEIRKQA